MSCFEIECVLYRWNNTWCSTYTWMYLFNYTISGDFNEKGRTNSEWTSNCSTWRFFYEIEDNLKYQLKLCKSNLIWMSRRLQRSKYSKNIFYSKSVSSSVLWIGHFANQRIFRKRIIFYKTNNYIANDLKTLCLVINDWE